MRHRLQRLAHGAAARPAQGALPLSGSEPKRAAASLLAAWKGIHSATWALGTDLLCYIQDVYHPRGEFKKTKVAMTIHNIAFQVSVLTSCPFCSSLWATADEWLTGSNSLLRPAGLLIQGRFWPKAWDTLGLPASSRAKFDFTDGYPRVRQAQTMCCTLLDIVQYCRFLHAHRKHRLSCSDVHGHRVLACFAQPRPTCAGTRALSLDPQTPMKQHVPVAGV